MGVKEDTPFYAMELVEGETLARILARTVAAEAGTEMPFGAKDDARYFANLADAFADAAGGLEHAHSKGIVHRDIKPSNLILDRDGRLRILDIGLARLEGQESVTLSGDFVGTPLYVSPEQAQRRKTSIDHRTDVYSLGATFYEAVCGRPPFRGTDHADTLSQIVDGDPIDPRRLNSRIPKDLETIILRVESRGARGGRLRAGDQGVTSRRSAPKARGSSSCPTDGSPPKPSRRVPRGKLSTTKSRPQETAILRSAGCFLMPSSGAPHVARAFASDLERTSSAASRMR